MEASTETNTTPVGCTTVTLVRLSGCTGTGYWRIDCRPEAVLETPVYRYHYIMLTPTELSRRHFYLVVANSDPDSDSDNTNRILGMASYGPWRSWYDESDRHAPFFSSASLR